VIEVNAGEKKHWVAVDPTKSDTSANQSPRLPIEQKKEFDGLNQ